MNVPVWAYHMKPLRLGCSDTVWVVFLAPYCLALTSRSWHICARLVQSRTCPHEVDFHCRICHVGTEDEQSRPCVPHEATSCSHHHHIVTSTSSTAAAAATKPKLNQKNHIRTLIFQRTKLNMKLMQKKPKRTRTELNRIHVVIEPNRTQTMGSAVVTDRTLCWNSSCDTEFDSYLCMANISSDIVRFWNDNKCQFQKMADIARQQLSFPVSITSSKMHLLHAQNCVDRQMMLLDSIKSRKSILFFWIYNVKLTLLVICRMHMACMYHVNGELWNFSHFLEFRNLFYYFNLSVFLWYRRDFTSLYRTNKNKKQKRDWASCKRNKIF